MAIKNLSASTPYVNLPDTPPSPPSTPPRQRVGFNSEQSLDIQRNLALSLLKESQKSIIHNQMVLFEAFQITTRDAGPIVSTIRSTLETKEAVKSVFSYLGNYVVVNKERYADPVIIAIFNELRPLGQTELAKKIAGCIRNKPLRQLKEKEVLVVDPDSNPGTPLKLSTQQPSVLQTSTQESAPLKPAIKQEPLKPDLNEQTSLTRPSLEKENETRCCPGCLVL